ncbi:hypothetical protein SmJEL517_g02863 [Synchytrium microbalum]|uniref:NADP-dependent oxidoreductase domain-containing protein n=1 Tax=Synchytrium microbalum TaxID=1806994 RepID=A0A507C4B5_9FUNG|nr:uncharacterized protein SmJEL517_g02863 [Synchytrium microbalum]TPX34502.1 hypothetical protein SmJEL517_g02863 [Synchytrium microbalum]
MSIFQAKTPQGPLAHYKILSKTAGVRVSPLCLGAMNFGESWSSWLGECSKDEAFKIMDTFYEAGGNFIDTANNYQGGESEQWVGEWMKARGNRDEIVIATKFTSLYPKSIPKIAVNSTGNASKSLHLSVRDSLAKLQTDYIDILYVHWWDYTTNIHELMQALNHLVTSGKVLYLGVSDTPAWVVSAANTYARENGLAPFVIYQGKWNLAEREFERDILPMAKAFGMALAPWSVMMAGASKTETQTDAGKGRTPFRPDTEMRKKIRDQVLAAVDKVAKELGATRQQICIAYVIKKETQTFPILGGRKATHLADNIKALELVSKLTDAQVGAMEAASEFDIGFPHDFVGSGKLEDNFLLKLAGMVVQPDTIPQV